MKKRRFFLKVLVGPFALSACISAGTFSTDFSSGSPSGTRLNGHAMIEDGILELTFGENGLRGSFVVDDLDAGRPVYGFDLSAKVRLGGGSFLPAEGFSINFDPKFSPYGLPGEEGTADGITFSFDIFDNGHENPPAPSIDLKVGGNVIATHKMSVAEFETGSDFVPLHASVSPGGIVNLTYKEVPIFENVFFSGYLPMSGGRFIIGAATGGLNENQWFDDITIKTFTVPEPSANSIGLLGLAVLFCALRGRHFPASLLWRERYWKWALARRLAEPLEA